MTADRAFQIPFDPSPKIGLLCGDQLHHMYLANVLRKAASLSCVVVQPKWSTVRGSHWPTQSLKYYHAARRRLIRHRNLQNYYLGEPQEIFETAQHEEERLTVTDINSATVIDFLKNSGVRLLIVWGTGIIRNPLFFSDNFITLNIHSGIIPLYRGTHATFWALYNRDEANVGYTVHVLTPRIDYGPINMTLRPVIDRDDTEEVLYLKGTVLCSRVLSSVLKYAVQAGGLWFRNPSGLGRLFFYRHRTPWTDFRYFTRFRSLPRAKRSLPEKIDLAGPWQYCDGQGVFELTDE